MRVNDKRRHFRGGDGKIRNLLIATVSGIWIVYIISCGLAATYFNYQFANENGFVRWLMLGEVSSTLKGFVWPYYIFTKESPLNYDELMHGAAPGEKPARLRLCVNADVPSYGNMREREDKNLQWLRAHKEEFGRAIDEDERWKGKFGSFFGSVDLADPKFLEGFSWTFSVGHTAGCLEYEKQLATQAASATDDALFDACINANLGTQIGEATKDLPDFELKQRRTRDDPYFALGFMLGGQRGHVDGCVLADALKRSGY